MNAKIGNREDLEQSSSESNKEVQATPEQNKEETPFITAIDVVTMSDSERFALLFNEVRALRIELSQIKR